MSALALVNRLLETEEDFVDPKAYIRNVDDLPWYDHGWLKRIPPGGRRMHKEGHGFEHQWEYFHGKSWRFVLSTYEDGSAIWSAEFYSKYFASKGEWPWTHAGIVKLPPGADLNDYLRRLKIMGNKWGGHPQMLPQMPSIDGPGHLGY